MNVTVDGNGWFNNERAGGCDDDLLFFGADSGFCGGGTVRAARSGRTLFVSLGVGSGAARKDQTGLVKRCAVFRTLCPFWLLACGLLVAQAYLELMSLH